MLRIIIMAFILSLLTPFTAFTQITKTVHDSSLLIKEVQANRRPPLLSSNYLDWFPIRIDGQEIGPLVYTLRIKNDSDEDQVVQIETKEYRCQGKKTVDGKDSVERKLPARATSDIPLILHPPREPGKWEVVTEVYIEKWYGLSQKLVATLNLPVEVVEQGGVRSNQSEPISWVKSIQLMKAMRSNPEIC